MGTLGESRDIPPSTIAFRAYPTDMLDPKQHLETLTHKTAEKIDAALADHPICDLMKGNRENLSGLDINREPIEEDPPVSKSRLPDVSLAVKLDDYLEIATFKKSICHGSSNSSEHAETLNLFDKLKKRLVESMKSSNGTIDLWERKVFYGFKSEESYWSFLKIPEIKTALKQNLPVPEKDQRISECTYENLTQICNRHATMDQLPKNHISGISNSICAYSLFDFIKYCSEKELNIIEEYLRGIDLDVYTFKQSLSEIRTYLQTASFEDFQNKFHPRIDVDGFEDEMTTGEAEEQSSREYSTRFKEILENMITPSVDEMTTSEAEEQAAREYNNRFKGIVENMITPIVHKEKLFRILERAI